MKLTLIQSMALKALRSLATSLVVTVQLETPEGRRLTWQAQEKS